MKRPAFLLCIISSFFILNSCSKPQETAQVEKPLFAKFEEAVTRPVTQSFETAGEIKADQEILVSAERQGQIEKIYIKEGAWVQAGAPLVKIKGDDIVSDLKKAEADHASYKKLYDEGAVSKLEYTQYEANLSRIQSQMANLNITAITSGTVGEIHVDLGDYVKAGDPVLDLIKLYPLRLSYSIPERLLSRIKLSQNLSFTTDSHPGETFTAKVDFISPKVNPMSRTILVRALVSDPKYKLKANQFAIVKQVIKDIPDALMVREEAVYLDQGAEYLYLADVLEKTEVAPIPNAPPAPGHMARRVTIKAGIREPGWVEITEGLKAGEYVIYAGLTSIYPGAKIVRVPN